MDDHTRIEGLEITGWPNQGGSKSWEGVRVAAADQFISIVPGSEDLHLQATSSAVDAGLDLSAEFSDDIDRENRSGLWDIWADELDNAAPDTTAPVVGITSPLDLAFLNLTTITVSGTVDDPLATVVVNGISAVVSTNTFTASVPLSEGTNILTALATDLNSLTGTASIQVTLDTVPPVVTFTTNPLPNAAGWNNVDTTVTFNATDALSGIATVSDPITLTTEGAAQLAAGAATDLAGNVANISTFLNIDKTASTLTGLGLPVPNANGWNNTDVIVVFTVTDALSGVVSGTAPVTVVTEGAAQLTNGTATDAAGNIGSINFPVSIDKTPPVVFTTVSPPPNTVGWHNTDATVTFTAQDSLSGVAVVTSPAVVSAEGAQLIQGDATDLAGNTGGTSTIVQVDKTLPAVALLSPLAGFSSEDPLINVSGTASDFQGLSDVTVNGTTVELLASGFVTDLSFPEGSASVTVTATDIAGNIGTAVATGIINLPPVLALTAPVDQSTSK